MVGLNLSATRLPSLVVQRAVETQRSTAFVMARSANGWTSWKNEAGKTLDSVYR